MSMCVEEAYFRTATAEECMEMRGSVFYRIVSFPASCIQKTLGTVQLWRTPAAYFLGERTFMAKIWQVVKRAFWNDEPFLHRSSSFPMSITHLSDPVVLAAFFSHHRSDPDSIFAPSKSMAGMRKFMQSCFPMMQTSVFDCTQQQTDAFHKLLYCALSQKIVDLNQDKMAGICRSLLNKVSEKQLESDSVDLSQLVLNYFSEVFGTMITGSCEAGKTLSQQLGIFKTLAYKMGRNILTEEDKVQAAALAREINHTTSSILGKNPTLFYDKGNNLNEEDRKALIFVCLFAAQDNTTTLLICALWFLAKNKLKQQQLRESLKNFENKGLPHAFSLELEIFFAEMLKERSPVPSVGRIAAKDLCLEYKIENEKVWRKAFFPKGEILGARIDRVAQNSQIQNKKAADNYTQFMAFGRGVHKCPGRIFAETSIKVFLKHILSHYRLTLDKPAELKTEIAFTVLIKEPVYAYLKPLGAHSVE